MPLRLCPVKGSCEQDNETSTVRDSLLLPQKLGICRKVWVR